MSMLRILRNLAVLVILAVAILAATPRRAEAKKHHQACLGSGSLCTPRSLPCCSGACVTLGGGKDICL